ncbi:MAG TPA: serine/threonine-protein kinase, partial [Myxococcota bacterium]
MSRTKDLIELPFPPNTQVGAAPVALADDAESGATDPSLVLPGRAGQLEPGAGARMVMDLFVHDVTGRLMLELPDHPATPRATLFFLHGEPVHADTVDPTFVLRHLESRGALAVDARARLSDAKDPGTTTPQQLVRLRLAKPVAVLEALRDEVRDLARSILEAKHGSWRFFDDVEFADCTPLTAVNPFGLVLDARRRTLAPDALLHLGEELALKTPAPLEGFANVAPRLRSFTGHVDLGGVVDGRVSAFEIFKKTGLDPLVGGLVLGTLAETGLIALLDQPKNQSALDKRAVPTSVLPLLVQADAPLSLLSSLPERGANEILALYLERKPERDDNAILGVDVQAPAATIEREYEARLGELDPRAIAPGRMRPYLLARAEELRSKLERAHRRRTAGLPQQRKAAYEILERLGVGGMAEVFRGRAADNPDHYVAIKRILPSHRDNAEFARLFLEEAKLARRVQHPNVVRVFTVGKSADDLYLAMELVDGCDVGELIRRSKKLKWLVPVDVGCRIAADACGGLHAAHTAHDREGRVTPILHRDVSPQNILVSQRGDVKLTDFGIA